MREKSCKKNPYISSFEDSIQKEKIKKLMKYFISNQANSSY